jgi:NADH:ubiquinone oxidoreductase subunit 6 (subunit J)
MENQAILFWILAAATGFSAIAVVVTQNIVRAATWLLFALAGVAGVFFLLGADFVAATQLLVYVGGTLVLVVFGVMLTAQGPFITMKTGAAEWVIAVTVGMLLFGVLAISILAGARGLPGGSTPSSRLPADMAGTAKLGGALLGLEEATPAAALPGVPGRARQQVSYLLPFEIVSVHLLVVLIGAAYLARAKRRRRVVS